MFQHTAARRRLEAIQDRQCRPVCFNTQPPEGGWLAFIISQVLNYLVSTHSRPKAAGYGGQHRRLATGGFNTQPPEGGWGFKHFGFSFPCCFNTQPPEGGWPQNKPLLISLYVSTHSRPKAAGYKTQRQRNLFVCFNTQPPEGGWLLEVDFFVVVGLVSTHSRPKAAGTGRCGLEHGVFKVSTHSRPKAAGIHLQNNIRC